MGFSRGAAIRGAAIREALVQQPSAGQADELTSFIEVEPRKLSDSTTAERIEDIYAQIDVLVNVDAFCSGWRY